ERRPRERSSAPHLAAALDGVDRDDEQGHARDGQLPERHPGVIRRQREQAGDQKQPRGLARVEVAESQQRPHVQPEEDQTRDQKKYTRDLPREYREGYERDEGRWRIERRVRLRLSSGVELASGSAQHVA